MVINKKIFSAFRQGISNGTWQNIVMLQSKSIQATSQSGLRRWRTNRQATRSTCSRTSIGNAKRSRTGHAAPISTCDSALGAFLLHTIMLGPVRAVSMQTWVLDQRWVWCWIRVSSRLYNVGSATVKSHIILASNGFLYSYRKKQSNVLSNHLLSSATSCFQSLTSTLEYFIDI